MILKNTFISLVFIFSSLGIYSQNYEPTILILYPNETTVDVGLKNELIENENFYEGNRQYRIDKSERNLNQVPKESENIRKIYKKQIEFAKTSGYYGNISSIVESLLQYKFIDRFNNLMIFAVDETSDGKIEELEEIAQKYDMQYVVNFPEVRIMSKYGKKQSVIKVQLYDDIKKEIVIDKEYKGDSQNPGFEFTCKDGSIECTFNNALSIALREITFQVASNIPSLIREKVVMQERYDVLNYKINNGASNEKIVDIIKDNDTKLETKGYYQGLFSSDSTKFVGFFILDSEVDSIANIKRKEDKHVNIITSDLKNIGKTPQFYAYVVAGIEYNSKWYFDKTEVTYFDANSIEEAKLNYFNKLQQWNYFNENSTELNNDFWETNFFSKVKDIKKDPMWEQYGEIAWAAEERNNRDYIGMYNIVANKFKEKVKNENLEFEKRITEQVLLPLYQKIVSNDNNEFNDYKLLHDELILIYPKEKNIVLNPVLFINNDSTEVLKYFVWNTESNSVKEWSYFKENPHEIEKDAKIWHYGSLALNEIKTLTKWNFGYSTLDDSSFWQNYILLKEEGKYKYLKQIEE
ncbi:MAG: hypothetical protein ACE364_07175 [Chlorobiota bacterium]